MENGARTAVARSRRRTRRYRSRQAARLPKATSRASTARAHRSAAELNDAVEKFNEAQRLLPNSPDPALGLARVYVYGLHDIDSAYQALQQAEKHGHPLGNREKAQLADGYRDRADRLFWDSRNVRDLPQEKDQIQRARQDYQRALELYRERRAVRQLGRVYRGGAAPVSRASISG